MLLRRLLCIRYVPYLGGWVLIEGGVVVGWVCDVVYDDPCVYVCVGL